jgi:hypothetical protein
VKTRTIIGLLPVLMCCASIDYVLAADNIILRTAVTPAEAWVGQKVVLHVDVLAKDGWAQLIKVSDAEVHGAYLLRLETQGTRLGETIDGAGYSGQRYEFMLFAQRDGNITVPAVLVEVEVKTWGVAGGNRIERMLLPEAAFNARTPPGAEGLRGLISTRKFTAQQNWDAEMRSATVGDAIKRRITLRAEDVSGMAFAPLQYGEIAGVGIYPGEPAVDDSFARGDLAGSRLETVTYVFEQAGDVELPDVHLYWWDVGAEELQQIVLPGLSLSVIGGALAESGAERGEEPQPYKRRAWLALLAVIIVVIATLGFGSKLAERRAAWRKSRKEREVVYFRQVRRSARSGDQRAVLRATMRWLDRINASSRPAQLNQFLRRHGESQLQTNVLDLDKSGIATLLTKLATARKRWQTANRSKQRPDGSLPDLNVGTKVRLR